jgi:hypothetical protein
MGTDSVRWLCPFWRTDGPASVEVESGDHARYGSLEEWSWTRDRENLPTMSVPRKLEHSPKVPCPHPFESRRLLQMHAFGLIPISQPDGYQLH